MRGDSGVAGKGRVVGVPKQLGFLSVFCQRGGKMRLYVIICMGGKCVSMCKTWGSGACSPSKFLILNLY